MDQAVFMALLTHVRKATLTADKFYLLQTATRSLFFSPAQCLDIVRCFTHSEDKAAIMDLIEKRLWTKVDLKWATLIVKSAAFSKDRLKILRTLLKHLQELTEDEAKSFVSTCFDSERDRETAWAILAVRFEFTSSAVDMTEGSLEENDAFENATPYTIFRCIEKLAKTNVRPMSAFDLPLLDELSLLRKTIIENRQAISDEVAKRHREGHDFIVPSRLSAITRNLKPGRRISTIDPTSRIIRTCATENNAVHSRVDFNTTTDASSSENEDTYAVPLRRSMYKGGNKVQSRQSMRAPASSSIWNIVNPAHSSPLSAYYMNKSVGVVR